MKKNDALAFNGCKGQKKNASHRDAVQHFQFAEMFKPFIHMTVFMNIILNQKQKHWPSKQKQDYHPSKIHIREQFLGFLDIITVKLSQEKKKGWKCRIKMNLMAKFFFSTLNVYTKLQMSNEIQCFYSISFEKPSSLEFILFYKEKGKFSFTVLPKSWQLSQGSRSGAGLRPIVYCITQGK